MSQPARQAVGSEGEQFYVTHCTTSDSVLNNPGYTVRAASTFNADVLDAAFHYPPYELPIDMWKDLPPVEAAPRRLARTDDPDGGVWAVHSSYVTKDTVDRDRSYFSHLMLFPSADPLAVLRTWGADGWATSYPQGAEKKLPGDARLLVGTLVSDESLTAFLGENPRGPTELSVTVCPARLRASATARRDVFARLLQALLVLAEEENASRRRLYIHAEPGLIALLLYGAVRLLPPTVTDNLTFSTFEPYHRNFRDYKLAEVVGTYLGTPEKGLDTDLATTRGIALDTFIPARCSAELCAPLPAGLTDLIDLAVRGEWKLLPVVRHAVGADPSGLPRAGKAVLRARALDRIDAGAATIDELLVLQGDRLATDELKLREDKVWPLVKAAALDPRRDDVRTAFRELLAQPEHIERLWEEGFEAILREDFRKWDSHWTVIRGVGSERARKLLTKIVGSEKNEGRLSRLPTDVRARLRAACTDVSLMPPRPLLVPIGLGELEPLLAAPPDCAGYTAFVLMARDELGWLAHIPPSNREQMRKRAREFLFGAPPAALAAYVHAARSYLDMDSAFLDVLFKPHSPSAAKLMDKLLSAGTLEPGDWMKLCTSVGLTQDAWGEYLLEKDRLASFLVGLGGDGVGREVWGAYLGLLTPALISPELIEVEAGDDPQVIHEWERKVHAHLRIAAERLTKAGVKLAPALPEGGVGQLFAANNLMKWVDDPTSAERDGWEEVKHACEVYELDPVNLVRVAYKKGGFNQCDPGTEAQALAPIITLFKTCFPVDANFNTASRATREVICLSHDCPESRRGAFQALLLHSCVPDIHYQGILNADWREPLHPYAVARLNEWITRAAKKGGQKYVPPASSSAPEAAPVVEAPFADEENDESSEPEPVIQKKKGKRSRKESYAPARKRKEGKGWLWVLIVVLGIAAAGLLVFAVVKLADNKNTPATQSEKEKDKKK